MVGLVVRRTVAALLGAGMVTLLAVVTPSPEASAPRAPAEQAPDPQHTANDTPARSGGPSSTPAR